MQSVEKSECAVSGLSSMSCRDPGCNAHGRVKFADSRSRGLQEDSQVEVSSGNGSLFPLEDAGAASEISPVKVACSV